MMVDTVNSCEWKCHVVIGYNLLFFFSLNVFCFQSGEVDVLVDTVVNVNAKPDKEKTFSVEIRDAVKT